MLNTAKKILKTFPLTKQITRAFKQWQANTPLDLSSVDSVNKWLLRQSHLANPLIPYATDVNNHHRFAQWIIDLHQTPALIRQDLVGRRILITAIHNPSWIWLSMPIGMALAGRGATVDYAWAQFPDPIGEKPGNEYYSPVDQIEDAVVELHPRFRLISLRHVKPLPVTAQHQELAAKFAYRDSCHILLRETCQPETNPEHARLINHRKARHIEAATRYDRILREGKYDWVIVPNGSAYEYGVCYDLAKSLGIGRSAFDCHERSNSINISDRQPCVYWDLKTYWDADEPHELPPERLKRVSEILMRRELPNWSGEGDFVWHGQLAPVQPIPELLEKLSLSAEKPTALMCTNLAWDSAVLDRQRTFKSMIEWIVESIHWFAKHPEYQLIVRVHPVEKSVATNEPVVPTVKQYIAELPPNVRMVDAHEKVNTYGLMRLSHCGLAYTSTVGLEMATRGLPVIVSGLTHYAEHGFTYEAANPEAYFTKLQELLSHQIPPRLTEDQVRLSICYADLFFEKLARPFPWRPWWQNGVNRDEDMLDEYPLSKLLKGDGPKEYLDTLDFFAGLPPLIP